MLTFYFHPTPNPFKVALMLEELGLDYEVHPVDTRKGEQHEPGFLAVNPNAKVPAIDDDGTVVFDSNAILLYLAQKHGRFIPSGGAALGAVLSWHFFVATGLGPFSGQAVHFKLMAPEDVPYAKNRYGKEIERHYRVLDGRLGEARYLGGDAYSIADIAAWGWMRAGDRVLDGGLAAYPNAKRLFDEISARDAAKRAAALPERFTFKQDMDEVALRAMFPSNY